MIRARVVYLAAIVFFAPSAHAQRETRGAVILSLPTSPRALALADASAAMAHDAWATLGSPAQLGRVGRVSAALASESYLVSTQLSAFALALPVGAGTLGVGASLLDYGSIAEIANDTETGRSYSAQDHVVVLAFGMPVRSMTGLAAGASLELASSRIADVTSSGVTASFGASWLTTNGWAASASVQHLGGAIDMGATKAFPPTIGRLSVATPARSLGAVRVRPMAEIRSARGDGLSVAAAAEAEWRATESAAIALRAGYALDGDDRDDRWPVALGAGVTLGSWSIDYAPQRFQTIDQITHRVGIRYGHPARGARAASR